MAIYSRTQIPKWQAPIRITRPYIKPNYLADTISSAIQGYGSIQNMNLQQQMFNARLKAAADAKAAQDAQQATVRGMFTNMANVPANATLAPQMVAGPHMDNTQMMAVPGSPAIPGMDVPTAISTAMQQNPNMDIGSLMKYAGAINQIHNPQRGLTWQDLVRQRRAAGWAAQDAAKNQAIIDAFKTRTSGNLSGGIDGLGEGRIYNYQTSAAGVDPVVYASDPAQIMASLFPQNNLPAGYVDDDGNIVADSMEYRLEPTKYEKAGGQLGWKMFVEDHLRPLAIYLQKNTELTDKQIQIEIAKVLRLGRAPQGQPGGAFNYRRVMSDIMRTMKGNTQENNIPTEVAESQIFP